MIRAKRSPSSAPFGGTCPYPLCRCATSSLPLLAFGHFPLTGGIVPLIRRVGPLEGGRLDGRLIAAPTVDTEAGPSSVGAGPRPARNYGPAITCSAKPGAVVEPHQRKFLQTQGPVARWEFRPATQILRAGNFVQPYRYASSVMGSGESGPMDLGGAKRSRSPSAASPAAFWLLCRRGQSNSPPAGGEIPPARNETALSSPPHPPQCAHWGTFPPGGRLMEKRR